MLSMTGYDLSSAVFLYFLSSLFLTFPHVSHFYFCSASEFVLPCFPSSSFVLHRLASRTLLPLLCLLSVFYISGACFDKFSMIPIAICQSPRSRSSIFYCHRQSLSLTLLFCDCGCDSDSLTDFILASRIQVSGCCCCCFFFFFHVLVD